MGRQKVQSWGYQPRRIFVGAHVHVAEMAEGRLRGYAQADETKARGC